MTRLAVTRGLLAALLALTVAQAAFAADTRAPAAPPSALARPYTLTTGEIVALVIPQLVLGFDWSDTPVVALYERDEDRMGLMFYGDETSADDARQVLADFDEEALGRIIQMLAVTWRVQLKPEDFHLTYYNEDTGKPVIERVKGEYRKP